MLWNHKHFLKSMMLYLDINSQNELSYLCHQKESVGSASLKKQKNCDQVNTKNAQAYFLESGGVDGGVHVFNSLFDLEFFSVKFVFKFVNGSFEFNDLRNFQTICVGGNVGRDKIQTYHLFGGFGSLFSILQFFFKGLNFFDVLLFLDGVFFGSGFKRFQVVGNSLKD